MAVSASIAASVTALALGGTLGASFSAASLGGSASALVSSVQFFSLTSGASANMSSAYQVWEGVGGEGAETAHQEISW